MTAFWSVAETPVPAAAATIYANGACSLAEAITSANIDGKADFFCNSGNGADTIVLQYDVSLTSADNTLNGDNGLPVITSEIVIESDGGLRTIERASGASDAFRIFYVDAPDGHLTLRRLTLRGGKASGGAGGCVRVRSEAWLRIENSKVTGCTAEDGCGVWVGSQGELAVVRSTFKENWTQGEDCRGGAISSFGTDFNLSQSTFVRNWAFCAAGRGGAVAIRGGSPFVETSTFSENLAGARGGAIWSGLLTGESGAAVDVVFCTFAGNQLGLGGIGSSLAVDAGNLRLGASIVDDAGTSDCTGAIGDYGFNFGCGSPAVTHLDDLANNGGWTQTHALLECSNAIDTVEDCQEQPDQRDAVRDDGSCDSGSFEAFGCQEWVWENEVIDGRVGLAGPSPCRMVLGPNWSIVDGGEIDIPAGREVIFRNDVWVEPGGLLSVDVDPDYLVREQPIQVPAEGAER